MRDDDAQLRSDDPSQPLRVPLWRELRDPVTEAQAHLMWRHVEERRAGSHFGARRGLAWASLGAALGVCVTVGVGAIREHAGGASGSATLAAAPRPGPLLQSNGHPVVTVEVPLAAPSALVALADGSSLDVRAGARIEPLVSSATEFMTRLVRGEVVFDVTPGGPRRWIIEAGIASVEVVGTRFSVDREADRVRVGVERGVVLVRGATLPDGVARVEAGASVEVRAPATTARAISDPATSDERPDARSERAVEPSSRRRSVWRDAAASGKYTEAYSALGPKGLADEAARAVTAEELLALADVARLSGHPAEAIPPLSRLVAEHGTGPRGPLAALTLGRIELDLGQPAQARRALERALALGVPAGLEEDVYARLVEANAKSGDLGRAREIAKEYRLRFPDGRRLADVARWAAE